MFLSIDRPNELSREWFERRLQKAFDELSAKDPGGRRVCLRSRRLIKEIKCRALGRLTKEIQRSLVKIDFGEQRTLSYLGPERHAQIRNRNSSYYVAVII